MRHLASIVAVAMLMAVAGLTDGLFAVKCGTMPPSITSQPAAGTTQPAITPTAAAVPATGPAIASTGPATTQETITKWIADLSSADGKARIAATKAIFALGEGALEPLKKAGAKQVTPRPAGTLGGRIDIVCSLLEGLAQDPIAKAGYRTDFFLLQVEKDCTVEDVTKMGRRCGFSPNRRNGALAGGITDGVCGVFPLAGKEFVGILKAILSDEPKVISIQLTYYSGPTP